MTDQNTPKQIELTVDGFLMQAEAMGGLASSEEDLRTAIYVIDLVHDGLDASEILDFLIKREEVCRGFGAVEEADAIRTLVFEALADGVAVDRRQAELRTSM